MEDKTANGGKDSAGCFNKMFLIKLLQKIPEHHALASSAFMMRL